MTTRTHGEMILTFYFHCYVLSELLSVQHRNYNKGDYQNLRRKLSIDWDNATD